MASRRILSTIVLAVALLGAPAATADLPGWAIEAVAPGVEHLRHERPGSLSVHAARIAADSGVELRAVTAGDRVGGTPGAPHGGRELTSDLCRRAGGLVCVNGDFFLCSTCAQSAGGLVVDGRPLRSFRPDLGQLSIVDGRVTTHPLGWSGRFVADAGGERFEVALSSLNRDPLPDGIALYTAAWGPATPPDVPRVELVLEIGAPLAPGVVGGIPVDRREVSGPIGSSTAVLVGTGASAGVLDRLWHLWQTDSSSPRGLALHTALSFPATFSIGGHPVLLRDGERLALNGTDPFVTNRHPRTLAGATATGDLLLVTVDGRRPGHSDGVTLAEATDLLVELGAVDAVNLDGGGSTTFVGRCGDTGCVRNRPSGGGERPVVSALAVVPVVPATTAAPSVVASDASEPVTVELPVTPPAPTAPVAPPPAAPSPAPSQAPAPTSSDRLVAAPPLRLTRPVADVVATDRSPRPAPSPARGTAAAIAAILAAGAAGGGAVARRRLDPAG